MRQSYRDSNKIVLSIVSHGQINLVCNLLNDLLTFNWEGISILLTINIPEDLSALSKYEGLSLSLIQNTKPKGFGENHNHAFHSTICDFFVVVNPDIRLTGDFSNLLFESFNDQAVGVASPVVLSSAGYVEDSVRRFPTILRLVTRNLLGRRGPDYNWNTQAIDVDWSAGMFVVFRSDAFNAVGGFDSRYFMYMEDADICFRLQRAGWRTVLQPACSVTHDARRASHSNLRHLRWHVASAIRFFFYPKKKSTPKS